MKVFLLAMLMATNAYAGNQWQEGTGQNTLLGSISPSDIDKDSFENAIDPLDRVLSNYQEGAKISYSSATTISISAGEVMLSNSAGTIRLMQQNAAATTATFSNIDTGAEASSTTYYVYAYQATVTDTDFDIIISLSSSAPTGATYYARLGSFYNDSSSNILNDETIVNDNNYYALQLGDWLSRSIGTAYLASTDGFVVARNVASANDTDYGIIIYSDSSNPPTTIIARYLSGVSNTISVDTGSNQTITSPIKIGDYYKVAMTNNGGTSTVYWIPNE